LSPAPAPLTRLPRGAGRRQELQDLGVRTIGGLAALPDASVAERLGADGGRAHGLAPGGARGGGPGGRHAGGGGGGGAAGRRLARVASRRPVRGRRQPAEIVETLAFPEAVGNELTLRRAF